MPHNGGSGGFVRATARNGTTSLRTERPGKLRNGRMFTSAGTRVVPNRDRSYNFAMVRESCVFIVDIIAAVLVHSSLLLDCFVQCSAFVTGMLKCIIVPPFSLSLLSCLRSSTL